MNSAENKTKNIVRRITRSKATSPFYVFFTLCRDSNISALRFIAAKQRNYLFMIAMHNNGGDLAQTVCIDEWLYKNYPNGVVINVAWTSVEDRILKRICSKIRPQDNVFIHSGYNITDICDEFAAPDVFPSHRIILETLKDHKIVFFPQSVEYKSIEKWKPVTDMYSSHPDIVFISRDKVSQGYAQKLLPNARHLAYPDIVTTWIGKYRFEEPLKDIFLCLRTGAESLLDNHNSEKLKNSLEKLGTLEKGDTDVAASAFKYRGHRKEVVLEKIREFSQYKIVVTDRYHGVIFSLIAGRPVIVLKTAGHKVKSAIDWFPEEFREYVFFIDNPNNVDYITSKAKELLNNMPAPMTSSYFERDVYGKLYEDIYGEQ